MTPDVFFQNGVSKGAAVTKKKPKTKVFRTPDMKAKIVADYEKAKKQGSHAVKAFLAKYQIGYGTISNYRSQLGVRARGRRKWTLAQKLNLVREFRRAEAAGEEQESEFLLREKLNREQVRRFERSIQLARKEGRLPRENPQAPTPAYPTADNSAAAPERRAFAELTLDMLVTGNLSLDEAKRIIGNLVEPAR